MVATRKAEKTAEMARISQIGDFKTRMGGIMELPSGLVVKARNPGGLKAFLSSGSIPNNLMVIIKRALEGGKAPEAAEIFNKEGGIDPEMMADMMVLFDAVALECIKEPKFYPKLTQADVDAWNLANPDSLEPATTIEDIRSDDKLYVDELPDDDKQFLFQWISGGTRDLERFREQQQRGLVNVVSVPKPGDITKRNAGVDAG